MVPLVPGGNFVLVRFGQIWSPWYLAAFFFCQILSLVPLVPDGIFFVGQIWSDLVRFYQILSDCVRFLQICVRVSQIWLVFADFGHIWSDFCRFCKIWSIFGRVVSDLCQICWTWTIKWPWILESHVLVVVYNPHLGLINTVPPRCAPNLPHLVY